MKIEMRKYMKYGKRVLFRGNGYRLIEDMPDEGDLVNVVPQHSYERYHTLLERKRKGVITDAGNEELNALPLKIKIDESLPGNRIRFINSRYDTLFEVGDLEDVTVNGKQKKVFYIDDYHFGFVNGPFYHICEFAELCERNGITVTP